MINNNLYDDFQVDEVRLYEYTEVNIRLEHALGLSHARWLRGAISRMANQAEFHHHAEVGLSYQHPLIRYDTSTGHGSLLGLAQGALLARSIPQVKFLRLGSETLKVVDWSVISDRVPIGPVEQMICYQFQTPYFALNQENHEVWRRAGDFERTRLLERVLIGNLLSLSKAVGLNVAVRLRAETDLEPSGFEELKPGVSLLGFHGSFRVNFLLPERWGIGKSSARGFGTLSRKEISSGEV
jgi:hypothetical protein